VHYLVEHLSYIQKVPRFELLFLQGWHIRNADNDCCISWPSVSILHRSKIAEPAFRGACISIYMASARENSLPNLPVVNLPTRTKDVTITNVCDIDDPVSSVSSLNTQDKFGYRSVCLDCTLNVIPVSRFLGVWTLRIGIYHSGPTSLMNDHRHGTGSDKRSISRGL
jgi:hypothetical protein